MNTKFPLIILLMLFCIFPGKAVFAQPSGPPPDMGPAGAGEDMPGQDRSSRARMMFMWRLVEYLELDDDTSVKFVPIFNKHSKTREELQRQERELSSIILEKVDAEAPVKDIERLIDELDGIKKQIEKEHDSFQSDAGKLLNDRQKLKLRVFDEKMKSELMSRYRRHRTRDEEQPEFNGRPEGEIDKKQWLKMKEQGLETRRQFMEKALKDIEKELKVLKESQKELKE